MGQEGSDWGPVLEAVERLLLQPEGQGYQQLVAAYPQEEHPLGVAVLRLASALVKATAQAQRTEARPTPPLPRPLDAEEIERLREQTILEFWEALLPIFLEAHRLRGQRRRGKRVGAEALWQLLEALLWALESWGFRAVGEVGEESLYDPTRHCPSAAEVRISAGESVLVETVGVEWKGRVLRPALVRRARKGKAP